MKKNILVLIATLMCCMAASAQIMKPVKWDITQRLTSDNEGVVTFTANISGGWHMYDATVDPNVGPTPLTFNFDTLKGVKLKGRPIPNKKAHKEMDEMFEAEVSWYTGSVTYTQKFTVTAEDYAIGGSLRYGACNDMNCIPPTSESFSFTGKTKLKDKDKEKAEEKAEEPEAEAAAAADTATETIDSVATATVDSLSNNAGSMADNPLWAPVDVNADGSADSTANSSLWYIFIMCFLAGFVALLTPCVWPMIPLTVSFFLKSGKQRGAAIRDALTYGGSIILIYLALGIIVTLIFGPSALNALSTNMWVNLIFFALLVVFAISFFGAFDIKLPESWANKMDAKAEKTTGLLSIFFMAFTLALVSFSCTGPIIGTLLVMAADSGDLLGPAVGMFGFALALAIPFCLFAMFPSMLGSLPSSGGWMNTVKVVLGFIELALSLKFLSVADLTSDWRILDREVFLVLWIVIFVMLGLYLLGKFNFKHYGDADSSIGVGRFFLSMISLAFAMYLVPGLWGAPLKAVSAFVPPLYTQDFNLYGGMLEEYDDYDEGMAVAAKEGRPVLIDFSGYGCVNCRKMEAAVLDHAEVKEMIEKNFVVIKLMVDEKRNLPEPVKVTENGAVTTLRTYGDYWSYLQRYKFNANAQPYYVILNNGGRLLSGPFVYKEDIPGFIEFMEKGIEGYMR